MDENPQELRWRSEFPYKSHWLELSSARMHYVDEFAPKEDEAGTLRSSSTLLFVHGNPTWSFHWRKLIRGLRHRHRCIAIDHLGCGLSDLQPHPLRLADHIDNLRRFVRKLGLRRATLIAQDWGGAIGLGALLAERDRFQRIVLFNTGAFPPPHVPWRIRVCGWPLLGQVAVQAGNVFSRAALSMTLSRKTKLEPTAIDGYLAPYDSWRRREAVFRFVRDIPLNSRHPTRRTLEHIEARLPQLADWPIQLAWGMQDWCFTPACLERFCSVWPEAHVARMADVGHWVVEDATDEALGILSTFLDATEPDPSLKDAIDHRGDATAAMSGDSTALSSISRRPK